MTSLIPAPFSSNKSEYNAFHYKLRLLPQSARDTWKIVKSQEKEQPAKFWESVRSVFDGL